MPAAQLISDQGCLVAMDVLSKSSVDTVLLFGVIPFPSF
jgi:hypothetical protein